MKNSSLALILLFLFSGLASAVEICGSKVYLHIGLDGGCAPASPTFPGTLCPGGNATLEYDDCLSSSWLVCCEATTLIEYSDDVSSHIVVTGAPVGTEAETAQDVFTAWSATHDYEAPAAGFSRVGTFEGFAYTSEIGSTAGTANVKVSTWKRSLFSKDGTGAIVPIENIGGSGSDTIKTGVKDAFTDILDISAGGSNGTGSLFQNEAPSDGRFNNYDTSMTVPVKDSISSKIAGFVTNHPAMNIFSSAGITADSVAQGACVWNYSYANHNVEFSFDRYADKFQILGSMILLLSSIWSLFIAFGRG